MLNEVAAGSQGNYIDTKSGATKPAYIPPAINPTAERYIRGMKKGTTRWRKLYGNRWKYVMNSTANKMATQEQVKMPPTYKDLFGDLNEKAVSKKQQRFFGMVRAAQKGEMENPSPEVTKAATSMSKSDVKDFAKTKHDKLPERKKVEEGNKSGDSSLRDWFSKSRSSDGTPGWVQLGGKYAGKPCAKQPGQTTKPKCGSSKMKRDLNKDEEERAFRRKNAEDPNPDRKGKAKNVATEETILEREDLEIKEGMTLKDFKANRKKNERRAASADAEKRGHVGKEWHNTGRKYSPDEAKSRRAKMSDDDRAARHRAAVDPDDDRDTNYYSADKTKNPKKQRKQAAMGEETINERGDFWHPDPDEDRKLGGPGANQRAREDRAAASKPKPKSNSLRPGESYMDYAKRKGGYSAPKKKEGLRDRIKRKLGMKEAAGEKDSCYKKVKSRYSVWPSAYASGALVKCRKVGAKNWGNKSEGLTFQQFQEKCWQGYKQQGMKKKGGKVVPNCVPEEVTNEGASWTRKEGQNKSGGLNEKGRKSYERENPGSDLKAPSKKVGNPRRASFCARMKGMKSKLTSKKTASDPDSRINKSLRAWNC